jgi:hypothetical protein
VSPYSGIVPALPCWRSAHAPRRRSPAEVTAIAQLTDGFSGYCPTIAALRGGGYSAEAIFWCRLEPEAGYKIVERSARLAHALWHQ